MGQRNKKQFPIGQAGVALVELAIAIPMLMLLLVGLIETGRYAYYSILVGNAARAGVQYGMTHSAAFAGMQTAATTDAQGVSQISATATNYCYCWDGASTPPPSPQSPCTTLITCPVGQHRLLYVKVTATGTFTSLFNYPGLPASLTITRTAVMQTTV